MDDRDEWQPLHLLGGKKGVIKQGSKYVVKIDGYPFRFSTEAEAKEHRRIMSLEKVGMQYWRIVTEQATSYYEIALAPGFFCKIDSLESMFGVVWSAVGNSVFHKIKGTKTEYLLERLVTFDRKQSKVLFLNGDARDFRLKNLQVVPRAVAQPPVLSAPLAPGTFVTIDGQLILGADVYAQLLQSPENVGIRLAQLTANVQVTKIEPVEPQVLRQAFLGLQRCEYLLGGSRCPSQIGYRFLNQFTLEALLHAKNKTGRCFPVAWQDENWRTRFWTNFVNCHQDPIALNNTVIVRFFTERYGRVSNFSPVIARAIYDTFLPVGGATLDFCAGYGARLLGFWASQRGSTYVSCEPNSLLTRPLANLYAHLQTHFPRLKTAQISSQPAESVAFGSGCFDLVFTSPPFFDHEQYSDEATQSIVQYPNYGNWKNEFLFAVLAKSVECLKAGGHLIINIKSVKDFDLVGDMCEFLSEFKQLERKPDIALFQRQRHRRATSATEFLYVFYKNV